MLEADSGWRVSLSEPGARPQTAPVTPGDRGAVEQAHAALSTYTPAVAIPGLDGAITEREHALSSALSQAAFATPALAAACGAALGAADGDPVGLCIDAPDPAVRNLPWELLGLPGQSVPGEGQARWVVARLGAGSMTLPPPPDPGALRVVLWLPSPKDTVSRTRAAALQDHLHGQGVPVVRLEGLAVAPPAPAAGATDLLHVVCHGTADTERVRLLVAGGDRAPGTVGHLLAARLGGLALVVLDVCEAAGVTPEELGCLPGALLACGARACLAPLRRISLEALDASSAGLYTALGQGATLAEGVREARRRIRALAIPHPDGRWTSLQLWVRQAAELHQAPGLGPSWHPSGWPAPGRDAAGWLEAARDRAERDGTGFVGLEHLVHTSHDTPPEVRPLLRHLAATQTTALASPPPHLVPHPTRPPTWAPTPRLERLGQRLPRRFSSHELAEALLEALTERLPPGSIDRGRTGTWGQTMRSGRNPTIGAPPRPATCLEVVGGPEDGRRITLPAGATLGRAAGGPEDPGLYRTSLLVDKRLSRTHLRWEGPGRITWLRPDVRGAQGEAVVHAGEGLQPSAGTHLRGRA